MSASPSEQLIARHHLLCALLDTSHQNAKEQCKLMLITDASSYFDEVARVIANMPVRSIDRVVDVLMDAYDFSRRIYLFGNGGSAALASHFACDLGKGATNGSRKRLQAIALTDNIPMITAWANDVNFEDIFAEQLMNFVQPGDVAFAISGSGNSANVLKALKVARKAEACTVGLTGFRGGQMRDLCDVCFIVPSENMQIIEDIHLSVAHAIFTTLRAKICQQNQEAVA